MKKILATISILIAGLAYAGPNDIVLNQRLPTDNGTIQRFMIASPVGTDCLFYFNNSAGTPTPLPYCAQIGSGLSISGGVISATPQAAQVNADWNAVSGVAQILNKPALFSGAYADLTGRPTLATVATSGNYNDLLNRPTIPAAPLARVFANPARSLNTAFQISTTRDAHVAYTVDISVTSLLLAGASGRVYLEYADDAAFTASVVTVNSSPNATGGVLNVTNLGTGNVVGIVPAGKYVRIRTANVTGTPTFTFGGSQEVLL